MNLLDAIIIAIIEGLTEFLPVSSTGHMVITSAILGIGDDSFTKLFEIVIQLGAILAVVVLYWKKFFVFDKSRIPFYLKLIIAVIPALVLGAALHSKIKQVMGYPEVVAATLFLGGIVLLFVDNWFKNPTVHSDEKISNPSAFKIGLFQCLSLLPGMSRSAATIIGGMQQKLDRNTAAEFSFFLAVPTMVAATCYELYKSRDELSAQTGNLQLLIIGFIVAFIVALIAIKGFIGLLKKYGFRVWGIYRILVGGAILVAMAMGYHLSVA